MVGVLLPNLFEVVIDHTTCFSHWNVSGTFFFWCTHFWRIFPILILSHYLLLEGTPSSTCDTMSAFGDSPRGLRELANGGCLTQTEIIRISLLGMWSSGRGTLRTLSWTLEVRFLSICTVTTLSTITAASHWFLCFHPHAYSPLSTQQSDISMQDIRSYHSPT